ncbi:Hypothetical predicted protein [Lecanosticta acicola]|uniref:Karyogamy protein 5 n=1 Tax=Lecanosticta acicola TaxID=111012 RepID=A0AAI9E8X0_9PEZI|nr:Hypothetical predicted protein [Lecanosticta acicola]
MSILNKFMRLLSAGSMMFLLTTLLESNIVQAKGVVGFWRSSQHGPALELEPNITLPESIIEVQKILSEIDTRPPCQRMAYKRHAQLCRSFDATQSGTFRRAEEVVMAQNIFAIRMTQCQLEQAEQTLPDVCSPILELAVDHSMPSNHVKACLNGIWREGGNPWTTYTQEKQNGLVVCQAMRPDMDKAEHTRFFGLLLAAYGDLNQVMHQHKDDFQALQKNFRAVQESMSSFNEGLRQDHEELRAAVQKSVEEVSGKLGDTNIAVEDIVRRISHAKDHLAAHDAAVKTALQRATDLSKDVSVINDDAMAGLQIDLEEMRNKYIFDQKQMLDELTQQFLKVSNSVELANDWSGQVRSNLQLLSTDLDISVHKVGILKNGMVDATQQQHRMQGQLIDMGVKINQTQEFFEAAHEHLSDWIPFLGGIAEYASTFKGYCSAFGMFALFMVSSSLVSAAFLYEAGCSKGFTVLAATGLGIMTSTILSFALAHFLPALAAVQPIMDSFSHGGNATLVGLLVISVLGNLAAVARFLREKRLYDPASPPTA